MFVGGSISSGRLDELVREVSGQFVASYPLPGRVRFRCLQYDAVTGRVALDWGFALLLVPVAGTGLTTLVMFVAGARLRRRAGTVLLSEHLAASGVGPRRFEGSGGPEQFVEEPLHVVDSTFLHG